MQELLAKIEAINESVKEINDQITREEGRKEEITKQMTQLLSEYNSKYAEEGKQLSLDDMESIKKEYLQEVAKKEQEATFMNEVITLINDGKYQEASAKLGVEVEEVPVEETKVDENSTDFASQVNTPAMQVSEVSGVVEEKKATSSFKIPDMTQMPDVAGVEVSQPAVVNEDKVEVPTMTGNLAHNIQSQPAQNIPTMPTAPVGAMPSDVPTMPTVPTVPSVPSGQGIPVLPTMPTVPTMPVAPTVPSMPTTMGVPNAQEPVAPLSMGKPFQG